MIRRRTSSAAIFDDIEGLDLDERFVRKSCISYFQTVMKMRPINDPETLEHACWLLGDARAELTQYLKCTFSKRIDVEFKEKQFNQSEEDFDYAHSLIDIMKQISSYGRKKIVRHIGHCLKNRYDDLSYHGSSDIEKNFIKMKRLFNLTESDINLCRFVFISTVFDEPRDFFDNKLNAFKIKGIKYLLKILGMSRNELSMILNGKLQTLEFLSYEPDGYSPKIEISDDFQRFMQNPPDRSYNHKLFRKCCGRPLPLDFHLIGKEELAYMRQLLSHKTSLPTHVLLYGPPGTGKSSFAEALAKSTGDPAYQILTGEKNSSSGRRASIIACINMTNGKNGSVIVVDEADNLLNTNNSWFNRGETQDKGWLNQFLERPEIRMIWITNQIDAIDPSVLRRFSYSKHFKPYTRQQRRTLWQNVTRRNRAKRFFNEEEIAAFAKDYDVTAGVIDLAVKKVKETQPTTKSQMHRGLKLSLSAYETLIHGGDKKDHKEKVEENYTLDGLNVSANMDKILEQIDRYDRYQQQCSDSSELFLNFLFYGPPGSGKSGLSRFIADCIDRPLISKRASDLLDAYVGGTEKHIRSAFDEAASEDAVLVFDEADSFLYNRNQAVRSWEVSLINEFLTQMEHFQGILICSTNRFDHLDPASIRRFSHKVEFHWLTPYGNVIFYDKLLSNLVSNSLTTSLRKRLSGIQRLAPGDFKTVKSVFSFYPKDEINHDTLISALQSESDLKAAQAGGKRIGF